MLGVVHVGAHRGEEVPDYIFQRRIPIILFEPQIFASSEYPGVEYHRVALGDVTGQFEFYIPYHLQDSEGMDTQSGSLLQVIPERARANGWTPAPLKCIKVPVIRFDEWAELYEFESGSCELLKIDVQGFELQVLRGFGDYLLGFRVIEVECSDPPIYKNGYSAQDVVAFLRDTGFTRVTDIQQHGDIRFVRCL